MIALDWTSPETHVLLNPRTPAGDRERLQALVAAAPDLEGHVWLATSGTTGVLKMAALSKQALLTSAAAVNRHLEASSEDVWGCVLPTFHVGGLGIRARAWLSGARIADLDRWNPRGYADLCERERVTLSSLVPAQVADLVAAGLRAPASLRATVIGGGALAPSLYERALALGWPVLPSYGLSECCSQVATARNGSPDLVLLDHVDVRIEPAGLIAIRSEALLTGYAIENVGFVDPKRDGWFVTEDLGALEGTTLRVDGRAGEFVKIGGESVDLARLDRILFDLAGADAALIAVEDDRLGFVIHAALAPGADPRAVESFNAAVQPFERIREVHHVAAVPRTALGKLRRKALAALVLGTSA